MKRLIASFAAALLALNAAATTLSPVQLLNPAGSSSGQAIVSTGSSTAPGWGTVPLSGLSSIASNTVIANATGGSAAPVAFSMPSCSTTASALNWTSGTGFTCNTAVNAAQLGGATFAAPGPIGSTTASTGAFTTLSASSTVSGTGFSTYLASPPAIGGTAAAAGSFTTLGASGNDALLYQNSNSQTVTTATLTTITNWTKVSDRVNANFNATTGTFTAPATGQYLVSASVAFAAVAGVVGTDIEIHLIANGTDIASGQYMVPTTNSYNHQVELPATLVSLTSGQTVVIQAYQNSGASRALSNTGRLTTVSIVRVP